MYSVREACLIAQDYLGRMINENPDKWKWDIDRLYRDPLVFLTDFPVTDMGFENIETQ